MNLQSERQPENATKSSPAKLISRHRDAPLLIMLLMLSMLFVHAARATTLLDPKPEDSTTYFGFSIAVVGDVDGDGVPDLAVGAPFQDGDVAIENGFGPPQDVGKVWLISGATLGVITQFNDPAFEPPLPPVLPKFGGFLGFSVAGVGDLNHDGVPDVLVGVPHHSNFDADHINAGQAFVFSGSDGSIIFTLTDPDEEEGNRFGYAVASLGDVNADGIPDLLVGVPKKDVSEDLPDVGSAYIFSGADGSFIRSLDPPAQGGAEANGRFGTAVADAGDVNHDGVDDILIGAPGDSRAYVFNGATGALIFTIITPAAPTAEKLPSFGSAVAGGKDLDRDGTPDFVIGAPLQNGLKGAAYVFKGSDGTLLRSLRGPSQAFAKFGSSVALIPDVTGDRRPDILVGAPDATVNSLLNAGEVLIFRGNNGKLFKTVTSAMPKAFAGFGYAVTTADFNNNGTQETVVGTPFEDADLMDPDGDIVTHLQIGQIEVQ
jgi:FG-GAP repeat protein/VCBS repeat protein